MECVECGQSDVFELSNCTFCGEIMCYDCLADHEPECEDREL